VFDPGLEQKSGPAFSTVVMGSIFARSGQSQKPRPQLKSAQKQTAREISRAG
jgi:hypothetical protein